MSLRRLVEGVERSNDFLSAQAAWKHGARTDEFYKKYGRTPETNVRTVQDFSGAEEEPAVLKESTRTRVKTEDDLTPTLAVKERRQKKFGSLLKSEPNVVTERRESRHRQSYSSDRRRSRSRDRKRRREHGHSSRHSNGRKRRRRSVGPPMRFPTPPRVLSRDYTSDNSSVTSESASEGRAPIKELADTGEALAKNPRILSALADLIMQRRGLKKLLARKHTAIFQPTSQVDPVSHLLKRTDRKVQEVLPAYGGKVQSVANSQDRHEDIGSTTAKNFERRRTVGPLETDDSSNKRIVKNPKNPKPKKDDGMRLEQSVENMRFTTVNDGPLHKPKLTDIFDRLEDT